jgi:hypothetical protein
VFLAFSVYEGLIRFVYLDKNVENEDQ